MNRILLGTSLLLTAGLFGQSTQAAPTYVSSANIVSPANKAVFTAVYPSSAQVPFSVTNQYVDISGATASSTIAIGWAMNNTVVLTNPNGVFFLLANDHSNGTTTVSTDMMGHFRRYLNGGTTGNSSATIPLSGGYGGKFDAGATITDAAGNNHVRLQETIFTVETAI